MTIQNIICLIMILSVAVADMATDLYSVALSNIASYFQVEGSVAQLTISLNLAGIAISGLIYGPLSDHYGRRPIMLIGMTIFTFASIACCIADNITLLILARFIQGMGSGVACVIGYASIRDMYSGSEYSRAISKLNMVAALSPGIAPVVGSYILSHGYGWHFLFMIIFLATSIMLCIIYFKLQETLVTDKNKTSLGNVTISILTQYVMVFRNYRFLGFAVIQGLTFMWLWAYIANYSFIFESMGIDVQYFGYFISVVIIFYMIGTLINRKYVSKIGMNKMLVIGLILPIISDGSLLYFYFTNTLNMYIIEIAWIFSNIGIAFTISNNVTFALEVIKDTGLGSAFISFCDMTLGAIGIYIVGQFFQYGILANLLLTITCSVVAILIYSLLRYKAQKREIYN
ncbi:MAG: multidrug effflux MFS transporter [Wolbachia endosymbiont of Tyrophagus putrescentiae]|nr:multidrug effflux MFS transporter [Wolbachia endosymbiont of Tyrophagus putrescentiae]